MLQHVYDLLILRELTPRWVGAELHVDIQGRAFSVVARSPGVVVRKRRTATQSEKICPDVCEDVDEAIAALGL
jgi:hypothetical protein